ncbi:MAG TPA: GNAT family protein [Candidatus Dormibacteraeota bacterium]|jgi:RimJ/RimL family protein N-acetyltransferase|nr:GNAT family protein [Candidatus Dormibacteraeota bacterium]
MPPEVRLREATPSDAELLELWQSPDYRGEFNDFGLPFQPLAATIRKNGLIGDERGALIIELVAGGGAIGSVSWHGVRYGPNPQSLAWNIGINLVPAARGHGFGGEAQRLLAERLFATTTANRVEAMTDVANVAEQRALEKAGFVREGVLRGAQFRAGAWHDIVVYSLLRSQPPRI